MSMEFVMGNSLEALPKTIDFNFEELKTQLASSLELYTGLVVTEDGIKSAKEDRAKLNKLREALETKRKEVKKECMAPYTDFEGKVKELVCLIDKPIAAIDAQLKTYEEQRRADKRAAVKEIYDETIGTLYPLLPFDKLWRDEWYNTGVSMKKIREAIALPFMWWTSPARAGNWEATPAMKWRRPLICSLAWTTRRGHTSGKQPERARKAIPINERRTGIYSRSSLFPFSSSRNLSSSFSSSREILMHKITREASIAPPILPMYDTASQHPKTASSKEPNPKNTDTTIIAPTHKLAALMILLFFMM